MTREPEWDADSRGRALRLTEYQDSLCKCGCGLPMAVAHSKNAFTVDHYTCYAGRAMDQVRRKHSDEADEAKWAPGWDDGRHYYVFQPKDSDVPKQPIVTARGASRGD